MGYVIAFVLGGLCGALLMMRGSPEDRRPNRW